MNFEYENTQSGYWNAIRGSVASQDYITATVLINEVKTRFADEDGHETLEQVYAALLDAADKMDVRNPFSDKDHFFLAYKEGKKLDKMRWEDAIAQTAAASRMPLLPSALIDVYAERFSTEPKSVLIAEAEKFVPNLERVVSKNINSRFVLTTQNVVYAKVLEYVFSRYDNVEVVQADIYRYEFMSSRFDLILSCPNFGGRMLADDQNFMCREFDMVAFENLLLHLNSGGRLVITLPGRITFASGKVSDLRQFIQLNYTIKEIAELPEGTIEYCGIKVYLLDIENNRSEEDDDIVVRRYSAGDRKSRRAAVTALEVADDTFVMRSELEEQGDWSIDRIFAQQDEDYLNFQNSGVRKDMIGSVAEVFRGKSVTKKDPAGNIGVVNISNIGEYDIDYAGLDHMQEEERKVSNYLLQDGDVLLPARGTAIRTAVFREQGYSCIASSNLIVIRPDPKKLDSTYLKVFLDSPVGNKIISGAQQGMTVMNISYKDLRVLEVPIPTMEKQQAVANEYVEELKKYRDSVSAAEQRWADVLKKLQRF